MMRRKILNVRMVWFLGLVLAGFFLIRAFTIDAHAYEDVEVYSSMEESGEPEDEDKGRNEIRLSRPEEAASRIADQSYEMVPGSWRLGSPRNEDSIEVPKKAGRAIASHYEASPIPVREEMQAESGRSPAGLKMENAIPKKKSVSTSDIDLGAQAPVSYRSTSLATSVADVESAQPLARVESREVSRTEMRSRSEALSKDSMAVGRKLPAPTKLEAVVEGDRYGLKAEPGPDTRIESPTPEFASVGGSRGAVQEVSIIISDYGYFPNRIFVTQNIPVKLYLTASSKGTLCFIADAWGVRKGVVPGRVEEVSFVPDEPGEYRFYCPVKSIEGKIAVRESPYSGQSLRSVAAEEEKKVAASSTVGHRNEPKNAQTLRSVIEEE